jgi:hypothetical protein
MVGNVGTTQDPGRPKNHVLGERRPRNFLAFAATKETAFTVWLRVLATVRPFGGNLTLAYESRTRPCLSFCY